MLSVLVSPPQVKLDENINHDEPVISIENGAFCIRDTKIERKTILKSIEVDGFVLEESVYYPATYWQPEEYDYKELCVDQNYVKIAAELVKHYVGWQILNCLLPEQEPDYDMLTDADMDAMHDAVDEAFGQKTK